MKMPAAVKKQPAQEVAIKEHNVVALNPEENAIPDYMKADIGQRYGMESLDHSDMATPRLKVIQGMSTTEKEQFSFLEDGDIFHTAHEMAIPQPFLAVPILIRKRFLLWRPRDMGGGILARADDAKHWFPPNATFNVKLDKNEGGANVTWKTKPTVKESGLGEWGTSNPIDENSRPAATLTYDVLLAFPEYPEMSPAVLSFQRTGIKPAQKLNLKLASLDRPIFQSIIRFSSFLDHSGSNNFYNVNTELAGFLNTKRKWRIDDKEAWTLGTEELYRRYKALYEQVSETGLDIKDEESLQADISEASDGTPDY